MDEDGHDAQCPAERQRACVAHEDFGRMAVEPQKTQGSSDEGRTNNRQFARTADMGDLKVGGQLHVVGQVGQDEHHRGHNQGAADGQTIHAVGQIHRIGTADDG